MKTQGQKNSQKHEKRLEKAFGGSRTAASGAFWSRKGDVRNPDLLIEHKYTGNKTFTLKAAELEKITTEAIMDSRTPIFGVHMNGVNYVILPEEDFLEIYNELRQLRDTRQLPGSDMGLDVPS